VPIQGLKEETVKFTKALLGGVAFASVATFALAGCSSDTPDPSGSPTAGGGGGNSDAIILANGSEPQNGLIPTSTNETGGGRIVDALFAGLVYYDGDGKPHNEVADSITALDPTKYEVKIADGWKFTNGEAVTAKSFVDAWNWGAQLSNAQNNSYFFEDIEGFSWDADSELTGLEIVDDLTFTIQLNKAASDFPLRLGYTAFFPLPSVAFDDMEAFGQNPIGNGPYKFASETAWQHDIQLDVVTNPDYKGGRAPQNGGLTFTFYQTPEAMYADLLSDNVDVIDQIPDSSMQVFEDELGDRAVNQAAAVFQSVTIPSRLDHFSGEEGELRRKAISMSINRDEITDVIFQGSRTPASDFTSPVIDGWSDSVPVRFGETRPIACPVHVAVARRRAEPTFDPLSRALGCAREEVHDTTPRGPPGTRREVPGSTVEHTRSDCGGHAEERRRDRDRGHRGGGSPERDVPGRAHQRAQGPRPHQRQDATALHPDPSRGPRGGGALAVRPHAGSDRLPLQVSSRLTTKGPPS
jgi:ABC-type oligopeptide transport system substrate-binding subunit